jgi:hypothetical protein
VNIDIETSLAAWLRALPAFDGVPVHTGQSVDPIPADQPVLIVGVESVDPVAAGFHIARASIVLATSSVPEGGLEAHTALADSLSTSLLALDALAAAFPPHLVLAGADLRSLAATQSDGRWLTTADLSLGVRTSTAI